MPLGMCLKFQTTKPLIERVTIEIDADYIFSSHSFSRSDVPAYLLLGVFVSALVEDVERNYVLWYL